MSPQTMTCAEARMAALAAARGELTPSERAVWRQHVAGCSACDAFAERVADLVDAAVTTPVAPPLSTAGADALFAAIEGRLDAGEGDAAAFAPSVGAWTDAPPDAATAPAVAGETAAAAGDDAVAGGVEDDGRADADAAAERPAAAAGRGREVVAVAAAFVAAAAAVLLVWLGASSWRGGSDAPGADLAASPVAAASEGAEVAAVAPSEVAGSVEAAAPGDAAAPVAAVVAPADADPLDGASLVASLAPPVAADEAVTVHAGAGATWRLERHGAQRTLRLDAGTVLVEFVGDGEAELAVVAGAWRVDVVGTVLLVTAGDAPSVDVLAGAVDVHVDGKRTRVAAGQAWRAGEALVLAAPRRAALEARVDVAAHEAALARARAGAGARDGRGARAASPRMASPRAASPSASAAEPAEDGQRVAPADPVVAAGAGGGAEPGPAGESVDAALRRGDWAAAAADLESMIAAAPDAPGSDAARLDVARLYLRRLGSPERAVPHLERFLERNPSDVAAPAARAELCRVAEEHNLSVTTCRTNR